MNQINARVLLVEDHRNLAQTICDYLERSGFTMDYAADGHSALHLALSNEYDAMILDIMLPGPDGFEICHRLRKDSRLGLPILMLTARDQLDDKLQGFSEGADDYLVKPFDMPELEARLLALIKRARGEYDEYIYQVADLSLDLRKMEVRRGDTLIHLSPTALRILKILMRESPNFVSRDAIERELWGDIVPDSDTLRSHLYNLRKAIDKPFDHALMKTRKSIGFKISDD